MADASYSMWSYWRDRDGTLSALEGRYPSLLGRSEMLRTAAAQIRIAEAAIEMVMTKLAEEED